MTRGINTRILAVAALALATSLLLATPSPAAKKKTRVKAGKIAMTTIVNAQIPDVNPPPPGTIIPQIIPLVSTTDIGRQGRGLRIRDVNVTVQTLGLSGMEPAEDVDVQLRAPNGATALLFTSLEGYAGAPGRSIGPLTLDDESIINLGFEEPIFPTELYVPWSGTATPIDPLAVMDDGPVMGTWTLIARDFGLAPSQNNLVQWTVNVQTGKPYKTK